MLNQYGDKDLQVKENQPPNPIHLPKGFLWL